MGAKAARTNNPDVTVSCADGLHGECSGHWRGVLWPYETESAPEGDCDCSCHQAVAMVVAGKGNFASEMKAR